MGFSSFTKVTNFKPPLRTETNKIFKQLFNGDINSRYSFMQRMEDNEIKSRVINNQKIKQPNLTNPRTILLQIMNYVRIFNLYKITTNYVNIEIIFPVILKNQKFTAI